MKKIILILLVVPFFLVACGSSNSNTNTNYKIDGSGTDAKLQQTKLDEIKDDYSEHNFTFSSPYKVLNPLDTNELSAYVIFNTDEELTYKYTVKGKTKEADYTYENTKSQKGDIVVPVIGLYADYDNEVKMTIKTKSGNEQTEVINFDTTGLLIPKNLQKANVKVEDNKYNDFMNDKLVYNSNGMAYDINGDLRVYGLFQDYNWTSNFTKLINDKLFVGSSDMDGIYYQTYIYEIDLMGKIKKEIQAPDNIGFHHDGEFDGENYYFLGEYLDHSEGKYRESLILKYDSNLNYKETIDLGDFFTGEESDLVNASENDIHFNSIEYIEEENQLVVSSRATNKLYSYDLDDSDIAWILGEKEDNNPDFTDKYLKVTNPDEFVYPSGQHSAYRSFGSKSTPYNKPGEYLITLFNNKSCVFEDGKNQTKKLKEDTIVEINDVNKQCYSAKSSVLAYHVNLNDNTVEMVDEYELDTRSSYVSNINEHGDNFFVGSARANKGYLLDSNWSLLGTIDYERVPVGGKFDEPYRINIMSKEQIDSLF